MNGISAFRSSFSCEKNKKMSCKALNCNSNSKKSTPFLSGRALITDVNRL